MRDGTTDCAQARGGARASASSRSERGAGARRRGRAATGDFAFLAGEWRIANRMLHQGAWIEFPGEATVHSLLAGNASVEELRIPARNFSGLGLRLYDAAAGVWNDHWVNGQQRIVNPPMSGTFENGVGTFACRRQGQWPADQGARRLGPDHADLLPLAPGRLARRRRDLGHELGDALDALASIASERSNPSGVRGVDCRVAPRFAMTMARQPFFATPTKAGRSSRSLIV